MALNVNYDDVLHYSQSSLVLAGCNDNGRSYKNGEEFTLSTDTCTKCTCQVYRFRRLKH